MDHIGQWNWSTAGDGEDGWTSVDVEVKRCPECGNQLMPMPDTEDAAAGRAAYQRELADKKTQRAKERDDAQRAWDELTPEQKSAKVAADQQAILDIMFVANLTKDAFDKHIGMVRAEAES